MPSAVAAAGKGEVRGMRGPSLQQSRWTSYISTVLQQKDFAWWWGWGGGGGGGGRGGGGDRQACATGGAWMQGACEGQRPAMCKRQTNTQAGQRTDCCARSLRGPLPP